MDNIQVDSTGNTEMTRVLRNISDAVFDGYNSHGR
jgi:hypothetical protein